MTERQLLTKCQKWLKTNWPEAVVWHLSDRYTHGVPDLYIQHEDKTYWIEFKKDYKSTLSMRAKKQIYILTKLAEQGAKTAIVWTFEQFWEFLNESL